MTAEVPVSKGALWTGRVLSAIVVLMLAMSAIFKFIQPMGFDEGLMHLGWKSDIMLYIGIVELACAVIYLIPRTAVLGAILVTAYLGGAVATHVRVGDQFFIPILLGMAAWGGLYLRDARIAALLFWSALSRFGGSGLHRRPTQESVQPGADSSINSPLSTEMRSNIKAPAIGLLCYGIALGLLSIYLLSFYFIVKDKRAPGDMGDEMFALTILGSVITAAMAGLIIYGGSQMLTLRSRGWAKAASILSVCTIISGLPGLIGIPVGIWSLMVLSRPTVKEAFKAA